MITRDCIAYRFGALPRPGQAVRCSTVGQLQAGADLRRLMSMLALTSSRRATVRPARVEQLPRLAALRRDSWHAAYRGLLPEAELRRMDDRRTVARMRAALPSPLQSIAVVHDGHGQAVGYAWSGPHRERVQHHRGEIYELYLDPRAQRRGLGRQLLVSAIWHLVERDLNPVLVWVLAANPARHFYEACGGEAIDRGPVVVAGRTLPRIAFSWRDALPLPL